MKAAPPREQVVILSSIDWDTAWQRHQIFAAAFAVAGREVFFVENTGFRNPVMKDLPRLWKRARNLLHPSSVSGANPIPAGLRVFSPRVLPPTWSIFRRLNKDYFIPRLLRQLRSEGLRAGAECVVYVPTASTVEILRRLKPVAALYDCASNFRAHPDAPSDFAAIERELLSLCDQVVCDSEFLFAQKLAEHAHVAKIHQGAPAGFFRPRPPRGVWNEFCYYGTWSPDLDARFPDALADAGFGVTVRGFSKGAAPSLSPQVRRQTPVAQGDVAESLAPYDAYILPYRVNSFLMGVIPAKIYECLAAGRPVIATPLPSLKALEGLIYIGETPEDWVRIARELPRTETEELRRARVALAREHSAEAEFERFSRCLADARRRRAERPADPGLDLVVLSPVPWSRAPQARREEAAAWSDAGRRVFFVELGGGRGWARRLRRAFIGSDPTESAPLPLEVELVPALFLPASKRLLREANASLLAPRLVDLLHDRGLGRSFAAVVNGHSPHAATLLEKLRPTVTMSSESDAPRTRELLAEARDARPAPSSPETAASLPTFLSGLGWISILYGFAKVSIFLTQMIAGRWLGPEEYGRANLVLAAVAYLQIVPMLGFPTAMGKFLSTESDETARARFVSTALTSFAVWTVLCLPILAFAHRALSDTLRLPPGLFLPSMLLAEANAVYVVLASPLLGLKRFAHRGLVETVYGLSAPLALLTAVLVIGPTYEAMIAALGTGFVLGSLYALWCQRRYLIRAFEPKVLTTVWRYATVASLNLLAVAFVLAPARFILHAVRGPQEVGLFSAYFTATIQVSLALLYMLQSVIVPMASDPRGQRETWALAKRRALPALFAGWAFFLAGLVAALVVFGRRYPLRWDWALTFSAAAALALAHGTLSALYSARDFSGLRISVIGGLLTGVANAALAAELIPAYGVSGAAAALAASFSIGLLFFVAVRRFERA